MLRRFAYLKPKKAPAVSNSSPPTPAPTPAPIAVELSLLFWDLSEFCSIGEAVSVADTFTTLLLVEAEVDEAGALEEVEEVEDDEVTGSYTMSKLHDVNPF